MHFSAMKNGRLFFETYVRDMEAPTVVDIGAQDVNGSLRSVAPSHAEYVGVDFVAGRGVDVILQDPYVLPFPSESVDVIVSSSCFEHSEMFWVLFLEMLRILKPTGVLYLNVPSNGYFHRYPVDCWRFYPDAGKALVTWAERNGLTPTLLESYVSQMDAQGWSDFVAVYVKDSAHTGRYPRRIVESHPPFANASVANESELRGHRPLTEDQTLLRYSVVYHASRLARRLGEIWRG